MSRIIFIFIVILTVTVRSQTTDELKRFMDTYDKLKTDQQANDIVKKGIESENNLNDSPVKLLIAPSDISNYYDQKILYLKKELSELNNLLAYTDTINPLSDFGYNFFHKRDSIHYLDNLRITSDYVLGYGDEIIISVWGQVEQYEKKYIQRDGSIYIDNVGLLNLGGKSLYEAKSYALNKFSKIYSTLNSKPTLSFFNLSVGKTKNINVRISGHVIYPGNYIVNPAISLTNLLTLSGGISETGSLRNIYLSRKNAVIDTVDLYPMISGFDNINFIKFQDGDVVIVPSRGHSIPITGSVRIPAYYELKDDNISNFIKYCGGLNRDSKNEVHIYSKYKPNKYVKYKNYDNTMISMGDSLVFPSSFFRPEIISISVDNREAIKIPWINNITYENIFQSVNVKITNIKNIELVRRIDENKYQSYLLQNYDGGSFEFLPYDFITIQLLNSFEELNTVFVKGSIGSPGSYPLIGTKETLNSIINRSGGLHSSTDISNVIVKRDTVSFGSVDGELIIAPGDTIIVNNFNGSISIKGEINNPGNIEWKQDRVAKDYILLAGGLTSYGDKKQIIYITPYGEAYKIKKNSKRYIMPGSQIIINLKPSNELNVRPDRFQQISSIITSLITIALLARSA